MSQPSRHDDITNRLLRSMPPATLERIWPLLEPLSTTLGDVLCHVDGPIKSMYFVNRGLVSLVKTMQDGRTVEIEAIGVEGITDPNALFGIDKAVLESVVQIPGEAFRIRRELLRDEAARDPALHELMRKYARFSVSQLAQTAACNRLHSLEERCCRWLLIAHDSALSDTFSLTHEFLAMMLGVQRSGVSIAARFLQKSGIIQYSRGRVTVTDRCGLEEAACECYRSIRSELDELFPVMKDL